MAFDPNLGHAVLFGGWSASGASNETWIYDGVDWTRRFPSTVPPARHKHSMAFNPITGRVMMCDGTSRFSALDGVWEWDGNDWTRVGTSNRVAFGAAMAFDPIRQQMLRFGGGGGPNGETRAWTGSQWTLLTSGGPAPRESVAMATDTLRNRVVLYGGYGPTAGFGARFDDTWEWNGTAWTQRFPNFVPVRLSNHSMTFLPTMGWILAVGGATPITSGPMDNLDTYAWNGTDWTRRTTAQRPPGSLRAPIAYDSQRDCVVFLARGETWEYRASTAVPGTAQTVGVGCPGSAGVPTLAPLAGQLPYVGQQFTLEVTNVGAFSLATGAIGSSGTSWNGLQLPLDLGFMGFVGCTAYVSVDAYDALRHVGGVAPWPIQIPQDPSLVQTPYHLQAFIFDPSAPGGGVVSNAVAGVVGSR